MSTEKVGAAEGNATESGPTAAVTETRAANASEAAAPLDRAERDWGREDCPVLPCVSYRLAG